MIIYNKFNKNTLLLGNAYSEYNTLNVVFTLSNCDATDGKQYTVRRIKGHHFLCLDKTATLAFSRAANGLKLLP